MVYLHANAQFKTDPTQTKTLRARYEADCYRRFRHLKGLIWKTIVDNDALDLTDKPKVFAVGPARTFQFTQDSGKVTAFMGWLQQAEDDGILEIIRRDSMGRVAERNEWQNTYVRSAYQKGQRQSETMLKFAGIAIDQIPRETVFTVPRHADALGLIYTRNFEELKGITNRMNQQISRELAEGLSQGLSPREIARTINKRIDVALSSNARVLAQTEIVRAVNEAALNTYEQYGIEGVTADVEFSTAGDDKVCPECQSLEGKEYTIQEARGVIPVHPRCRCAWLPITDKIRKLQSG